MCDIPVNVLNEEGYSALHLAVLKNKLLVMKKLISCFVNIDVNTRSDDFDGNTAFHLAEKLALSGDLGNIKLLVSKGANLMGSFPVHYAVQSGHLEAVKFLISNGADKNARKEDGSTPSLFSNIR
ncbi:hypothetical protein AVEN_252603-1 [Araneus ventricosus]|uniref:Uncharacterized protein n=1 Tax=Araneus ventricosus TaxID=182803 RepID=A0A4Y2ARZ8_ARAVE|nr:hypothetical protein AVEN_252603-1 [Araneus ventricosus]